MNPKRATDLKIAVSIFRLESSKGHLLWKVTDLVQKSKSSRSHIYRYFGRNKREIFESAVQLFIDDFYGFDPNLNRFENLSQKITNARKLMEENAEAILFYQKWRAQNSDLQSQFLIAERKFQKKLSKLFPTFSGQQVLLAHACIHGLVTAPFLSAQQAGMLCDLLATKKVFS